MSTTCLRIFSRLRSRGFDDYDRSGAYSLNGGDTIWPILEIVYAVVRHDHPMPENLLAQLRDYLDDQAQGYYDELAVKVRAQADLIRSAPAVPEGEYGYAEMGLFILHDLGLQDASHEVQADGIRGWLMTNRPSPTLRYMLPLEGFGDLLNAKGQDGSEWQR